MLSKIKNLKITVKKISINYKKSILDNLLMEKKMVLECYLIKIFKVILETFQKTNLTEMERLYLKMEILIKVNLKIIN